MTLPGLNKYLTITCTCGHARPLHVDGAGACEEPTGRCGCPAYAELCPICKHAVEVHVGGACTRVKLIDRTVCGCAHYPADSGS